MKKIKWLCFFTLFVAAIATTACSKDDNDGDEPNDDTSGVSVTEFTGLWMKCKQVELYSEEGGKDKTTDYDAYTYTYIRVVTDGEDITDGVSIYYLDNQDNVRDVVACQVNGNEIMSNGRLIGEIEKCSHGADWDDLIILWEKDVVFNNCGSQCRVRSYYMYNYGE